MKHEQEFTIPIPGTKKRIYAKQYGSLDKPVVVFVHGLTGHMDEHMFYNGAHYFHSKGFSSLRFNLYDFDDDSRKLIDCTIKLHAEDLDTVIAYLRKEGVPHVFVVGHSLGAPTIASSEGRDFTAVALWDPGFDASPEEKAAEYVKEIDAYRIRWNVDWLASPAFMEELGREDWSPEVTQLTMPVKIVVAGKGQLQEQSQKYLDLLPGNKELVEIPGATHNFSEEGAAEQLYDETIAWFKNYV